MTASSPAPDTPPPGPPPPALQRAALHAVASGLTPLIPVPLLDDVALRRVRRSLVRTVLGEHGLTAPDAVVSTLAGEAPEKARAHVARLLHKLALAPVTWVARRTFRTLVFTLLVKDCVDVASASLHQGYLLQHALARGHLDASTLQGGTQPARVAAAIAATCREVDPRPVNQLLRRLFASSRALMATAVRVATRNLPRPGEPAPAGAAGEVASLSDTLAKALWEEQGYLQALAERYERHLQSG